ncbi:unnamed protein product [Polarella glacialis]|uniref:Kinesin motor domain-containing protein n=1 Tax=Polarella glacialis TaxID=89957 RepID=A0A813I291_POLGL|nr:unnamed protein product [Polarella glacialis]
MGLATDMRLVSEASSTIQVKASHAERQSLSMLLNTMCDVVVELDSFFGLVDKGERLSAFLCQGPGRSLRKTCFLDLMYQAADRQSFRQHLMQPRHGLLQDMAIPIHSRLRDSGGFALHVELIHAQYERLDGSVRYIVGIKELAEGSTVFPAVPEVQESEILETSHWCAGAQRLGKRHSRVSCVRRLFFVGDAPRAAPRAITDPSSSETKLLLPNLRETPVQTRLMSILSLMSRWNVQVSGKTCRCCTFHAVAKEVMFAANLLKHKACLNMAESLCNDWQCPSCGIMDLDAGPPRNPRAAAGALAADLEVSMVDELRAEVDLATVSFCERVVDEEALSESGLQKEAAEAQLRAKEAELRAEFALARQGMQREAEELRDRIQSERDELVAWGASERARLEASIAELRAVAAECEVESTRLVQEASSQLQAESDTELTMLKRRVEALSAHLTSVLTPVSAVCRARPFDSYQSSDVIARGARGALGVDGGEINVEDAAGRSRKFKIDRYLDGNATQEDLFLTAAPWVEHAALGGTSCVFAYGATGAGKTHSMLGDGAAGCSGLAHHALRRLIEGQGGGEVRISMLEVYCEQIRDLLAPAEAACQPTLQCSRRDTQGRMLLDCVEVLASKASDAEEWLMKGFANRATEGTLCNERSSRSHVMLTLQVMGKSGSPQGGRLVLVDLAGSENVQRSGADENCKLMAEAKAINRSLSALADVVEATAKQQSFVPYRNSRLTMLLEEALSSSKVLLLVHVSPFIRDATDTAHSLQFASRVRAVDFGAQRMRQDQEDRAKAAQLRSQQEARQLQGQLEQTKRELTEAQKTQTELKQHALTLSEQLRERQRELGREQELRAKAEESARSRNFASALSSRSSAPTGNDPRLANLQGDRAISPDKSVRGTAASRLPAPRACARSPSTPVPVRPREMAQAEQPLSAQQLPLSVLLQRPECDALLPSSALKQSTSILLDSELADAPVSEPQRLPSAGLPPRPPLGDRTNSDAHPLGGKDTKDAREVSVGGKFASIPSPARGLGFSPMQRAFAAQLQEEMVGVVATPTRLSTAATPERTPAALCARSPLATSQPSSFAGPSPLAGPSQSAAPAVADAAPGEKGSPGRWHAYEGKEVRSALKRVPSEFRCRLLRRQESPPSLSKRVVFADVPVVEASSPPRWYMDWLENDQAEKRMQLAQQQEEVVRSLGTPRALTPPSRRRIEVPRANLENAAPQAHGVALSTRWK